MEVYMEHDHSVKENLKEISKNSGIACVGFNLRKATRLLSQIYDQALKPAKLKGTQFSLLMAVAGQEDTTIGKLARPLGMERSTVSRNAKILEKRGLVKIEEGEDRRLQRITLTEKGALVLQEALPLWESVQERLAGELGEERLKTFMGDLKNLSRIARKK
ncbi:MarR family winged helix-turn-helix transcriptional regulator [Pelotomaculum sp. FP]|uniref:MarR family winged helix-turn-helix transcriptional regulator n=1 Tax=Pelotomaculum sp. FP TaxID=261474 RepID=UPI00195FF570|nr:MarR family winged helix-turn-helix transcriptional regulator [Pelotomaculum sp. FP]